MDPVTLGFLLIGGVGVLLLAAALLLGDLFHIELDSSFSVPAVAGFVGAFGFAGALGASLTGSTLLAAAIGLAAAIPIGWLVARMTRFLVNMATDGTLTAESLIGSQGIVVTRVPAGGYGEVRVMIGGQPLKLNAKADAPLAAGTAVFVIAAPTESSVVVVETTAID